MITLLDRNGWRRLSAAALLLSFPAMSCAAEQTTTFASLLEEMVDREVLARLPDPAYTCHQASSYERASVAPDRPGWFANRDWSHFLRSEIREGRKEWVMLDAAGPGCVVRMWMGASRPDLGPQGTLRFYLDGADTPAIEEKADALLSGRSLVGPPLSAIRSIGRNLYLPIPFSRHLKITYDQPNYWETKRGEDRSWYMINYRRYAPGTVVESFSMEGMRAAKPLLHRVQRILLTPSNTVAVETVPQPAITRKLSTGEIIEKKFRGEGAIRWLAVQLHAEDLPRALRSTILRMEFDGSETVWCPLGDFFGSGVGLNPYRGWWRAVDRNGLLKCYWVMPYRDSCTIRLENLGKEPVEATLGMIGVGKWAWDDRTLYFHANWRQEYPFATKGRDGFDWNYIEIEGTGVYAGDTLAIHNGASAWWGEGDEKIFVDGESFPSHFGTGTEDYYGYSFGDQGVFFEAPFHAQPRVEGNNRVGHSTNTRTRSLDAIPFSKSLKVDMEVWHWAQTQMAYAVATYWYARPGARSNRPPAPEEAIRPLPGEPTWISGAIEGEAMKIRSKTGGITEVQRDLRWSGGKQLWWRDAKPGDRLELILPVERTGLYEIQMHNTRAFDYGIFQFSLDGEKLGEPVDLYSAENIVKLISLGKKKLEEGEHIFTAEITGIHPEAKKRYMLGLDHLRLEPAP